MSSHTVPETRKAALEDIDVLFETNPTWVIGPKSTVKMAEITSTRLVQNQAGLNEGNEGSAAVDMVEDASSE